MGIANEGDARRIGRVSEGDVQCRVVIQSSDDVREFGGVWRVNSAHATRFGGEVEITFDNDLRGVLSGLI